MTTRLCVIILTYNHWVDTETCLESLARAGSVPAHIIIVDNASTDDTVARARRTFPEVEVIANPANLGYAQGNNRGLQHALDEKFEYVMVLNNDVTIDPACLQTLLCAADENPNAALIGPMVYHARERDVIQSAGGILPPSWRAYHRGANETDHHQFRNVERVDWLTGCAVLARTSMLAKFGLLDPDFFMYGEDVDWAVRARRAGFDVLFVPTAHVWHSGVQRDYAPAPYVTYYSARNELYLIRKHRAGVSPWLKAWLRHMRTVTSYSLLPRWRSKRDHRDALGRAMRDALLNRMGPAA